MLKSIIRVSYQIRINQCNAFIIIKNYNNYLQIHHQLKHYFEINKIRLKNIYDNQNNKQNIQTTKMNILDLLIQLQKQTKNYNDLI
ncbi:unnamed protein product [Paramecium pentaurelia]|uniref:Uncharacterized protein n=1 Tax=Paramecium pentaurelia TaxID=43138 RepID=A0A8S1RZL2_9CILI|nr:unnamed protein product [Paramecium pentaurelia]